MRQVLSTSRVGWARRSRRGAIAAAVLGLAAVGPIAFGQTSNADEAPLERPVQIRGMEVEEKLGAQIPPDLIFTNSDGKMVQIGDYFKDGKPAIVGLVYYKCPIVCSVLMDKMTQSLKDVDLTVGKDFRVLLFSFDFTETTELAAKLKAYHVAAYDREPADVVRDGFQFHTSDSTSARNLANALGFKYRRLDNGEYTHPAALFVISPEGKVSRYLYGFLLPPRDVKLSLIEASEGRLAKSLGDRLASFCYEFDPEAGAYTLQAMRVMQVGAVAAMLGVGGLVGALFVGERVRRRMASTDSKASVDQAAAAGAASTGTDR